MDFPYIRNALFSEVARSFTSNPYAHLDSFGASEITRAQIIETMRSEDSIHQNLLVLLNSDTWAVEAFFLLHLTQSRTLPLLTWPRS